MYKMDQIKSDIRYALPIEIFKIKLLYVTIKHFLYLEMSTFLWVTQQDFDKKQHILNYMYGSCLS